MPNVALILKTEIRRLARREVKAMVFALKRETLTLKRVLRDLTKKIRLLETNDRQIHQRLDQVARRNGGAVAADEQQKRWFTSKGIRATRRKFKMSQAEFGKLLGVSDQSIYQWERKGGVLKLRRETSTKVTMLRGLSVREARRRLEEGPLAVS